MKYHNLLPVSKYFAIGIYKTLRTRSGFGKRPQISLMCFMGVTVSGRVGLVFYKKNKDAVKKKPARLPAAQNWGLLRRPRQNPTFHNHQFSA